MLKHITLSLLLLLACLPVYNEAHAKGFKVSNEIYQRYIKNYPRLRVGMLEQDVVKLLGNPYSITDITTRKTKKYAGAIYKYYIRRKNQYTHARYYDQLITISFNQQGRLKYAFPHNMANFKRIGFPKEK